MDTVLSLLQGGRKEDTQVWGVLEEEKDESQGMGGAEVGPWMETRNNLVLEKRGVWDTRIQQLVLVGTQELEEVYRERWAGRKQRVPRRLGSQRREQEGELRVLWGQLPRLGLGCRAGGRQELLEELLKGRAVALGALWAQVHEEVAAPEAPAALPTS